MVWNTPQQIALATFPKISSVFSLFGSCWIVIEIVTHPTKRKHSYHRLLCAMSVYDILEDGWNFASTWPIPPTTVSSVVWNIGSTNVCSVQGFFLTASVAVPIYNAFLGLYYVLVVNFNIPDRVLRKRVEPTMHIIAFLWAVGTASISAGLGLFNDANLWCWIAPFPSDCKDTLRYGDEEGNCIRGNNAWIYRWIFYFVPLWSCIGFATICTCMVYHRVNRLDKRTLRFRRPQSIKSLSVGFTDGLQESSSGLAAAKRLSAHGTKLYAKELAELEAADDDFLCGTLDDENTSSSREFSASAGDDLTPQQRRAAKSSGFSNISFSTPKVVKRWKKRRKIYHEDYSKSVEVANQAMWYLGVFYSTHIWSTTNRIVQQVNNGSTVYGLILFHAWFDPFQGFLNFIVYQRPRILFHRKRNPELGWIMACRRALQFSFQKGFPDDKQLSRSGSCRHSESMEFSNNLSQQKQRAAAAVPAQSSSEEIVTSEECTSSNQQHQKPGFDDKSRCVRFSLHNEPDDSLELSEHGVHRVGDDEDGDAVITTKSTSVPKIHGQIQVTSDDQEYNIRSVSSLDCNEIDVLDEDDDAFNRSDENESTNNSHTPDTLPSSKWTSDSNQQKQKNNVLCVCGTAGKKICDACEQAPSSSSTDDPSLLRLTVTDVPLEKNKNDTKNMTEYIQSLSRFGRADV